MNVYVTPLKVTETETSKWLSVRLSCRTLMQFRNDHYGRVIISGFPEKEDSWPNPETLL